MKEQYTLGTGIEVFLAVYSSVDASDKCVNDPDFMQMFYDMNRTTPCCGRTRRRSLYAQMARIRRINVLLIDREVLSFLTDLLQYMDLGW
jgi:hypothetical protein